MKKFSNLDNKSKHIEINKPKISKMVEKLIKKTLTVAYSGNSDEILDKKLSIDGIEKFVEKLTLLIDTNKENIKKLTIESLKYQNIKHDQISINQRIDFLKEQINDTIILSPEDIFSEDDYTIENKNIILKSLNNIPIDYLNHVNIMESERYFKDNTVLIRESNKGWSLSFINSDKYGIVIDTENDKYAKFIKENSKFIADFILATTNLIGNKNLLLDKKLTN